MQPLRSLMWMALCAACNKGPSSLEVATGSYQELPLAAELQTIIVRTPSEIVVIQNYRNLLTMEVGSNAAFPREISIPVRTLDDGSHKPIYLVALPTTLDDGRIDLVPESTMPRICIQCEPCCVRSGTQ
jgi:hypothetical protein